MNITRYTRETESDKGISKPNLESELNCQNRDYLPLGPLHMSPVDRAGSVTGMNFALGSYEKFQPGFRDEKRSKILGTSSGA